LENKKKIALFVSALTIIFISMIAYSYIRPQTPIWQRLSRVQGSYQLEGGQQLEGSQQPPSLTLVFHDDNVFWSMILGIDDEIVVYGRYLFLGESQFVFEGDNIGDFERFEIINSQLDIEVIIDGERYIFRHIDDVPLVTGDFDPTFLEFESTDAD